MILSKANITSIDLFGLIDENIRTGKSAEQLIIVPTNRKLRSLKKEIINNSPNQTSSVINIETLSTLFTKILEQLEQFISLSEAAASVFIKQSAEDINLNYFTNYRGSIPNGTLDRIKNVISEYKKHGITPNVLRREAESLEKFEKLKAIDIADIYENYKEKTISINGFEIGDVYEKLLDYPEAEIFDVFTKLFPQVKLIVLVGFDQFTIPEINLIDSLSNFVLSNLYIDFDYYTFNPLIFSHLEETYKILESKGYKKVDDKSIYDFPEFKKEIREKLFLKLEENQINNFNERITSINGRNTEEEIELIAKQIKKIIADKEVEPHKICVAFNLISEFSPLVRDVFERFGIPFNLTDRTSLDQSPPVIAVINFLEILDNDFYYKNIFRAFSGRFLSEAGIDIANLNFIASKLKIVSGRHNWMNAINAELEYENGDEETLDKIKLKKALEDLTKINNLIMPFDEKLTPSEFFKRLLKFITDSKISITVLEGHPNHREEDIAALTKFIETIDEILQLIEKQTENPEKYSLTFYLDQIKTACSWARFNIKGRSDDGVLVTSIDEIRGLSFDHLFIAGMNDGIFPTRYTPEIFFSGSFAKKEITHQTEERYHFYQALSTWRKHLYLAYSNIGEERELIESSFLKDFLTLFKHNNISYKDFESTAFSYEDLQINLGNAIYSNNKIEDAVSQRTDLSKLKEKIEVSNKRRKNPHKPEAFNGFVGLNIDEISQKVLSHFAEKEFSISQLETYAKCPFKYFLQYVLKLSEIGEPTEEVEPIEIGSILHKILYEFYTTLRENKIILTNCTDSEFSKTEELIFRIAEKNLDSPLFLSEISFYERERILGIDGDRNSSILYQFIKKEREESSSIVPSYFEVAFGNVHSKIKDEDLSSPEPIYGGKVKFRGKIDRIDVNTEKNSYDIIDYKLSLSRKPTRSELEEGISLQLPLYLFAAKKLFERKEISLSPSEVYLYSLKFKQGEFGKHKITLVNKKADDTEKEIESLFENTLNKIENYIEHIVKGEFPLTNLEDRQKKVCNYCDFNKICRVEETDL